MQPSFYVAEARFWADDVIARGEEFSTSNAFSDKNRTDSSACVLVWCFCLHLVIADMFDDFRCWF